MPRVDGVDHRFLRIDGRGFHVATAGGGPAVILLHGWPQHWWCWRHVIPRLAEKHRVLAPDLRGFGWSDVAWTGLDRRTMAADIAGLIGELGVDRATVIGQGWGGWIASTLAIERPDLVERLVLLGAPAPGARIGPADLRIAAPARHLPLLATRLGMRRVERRFWTMRILRRMSFDRTHLGKEVQRRYARDLAGVTRARAAMLLHRRLLTHELPALLARSRGTDPTAPTLSLLREHDRFCTPRLAGTGLEREALEVRTVAGAGHLLAEEKPREVAEAIAGLRPGS